MFTRRTQRGYRQENSQIHICESRMRLQLSLLRSDPILNAKTVVKGLNRHEVAIKTVVKEATLDQIAECHSYAERQLGYHITIVYGVDEECVEPWPGHC